MAEVNPMKRKISAASARTHTRKAQPNSFTISSTIIVQIAVGVLIGIFGCLYLALKPPPSRICGSPGGPPVTSPRVKLSDGRHLSYKEKGVPKDEAKHKVIVSHGFADSKDFNLPISKELLEELKIYILSFDRAGYGESDPNPSRSVKSEASDIQELADKLQIGPKFYVIGISIGAYASWSCLKYIPHRLSGVAHVVPMVNYWWPCFPSNLSKEAFNKVLVQDKWVFRVGHHAPWLLNWWMTQKWFPSSSALEGKTDIFSRSDLEILKQISETPKDGQLQEQEKVRQQGDYECLHRDIMTAFGKWEFHPLDLGNPFPNNEGSVHIWQAYEDKVIPFELNRYLSQKLPWIQYHEVPDAGHLLIYNGTYCESIFKALVSS